MKDISVCIITKNQADKLRKCLEHLTAYPWHIVVVDTGSRDDSLKVAREFTDEVYEFAWIDDFAAAKNFAASKSVTDYVLIIDTDEYLEKVDKKEFLKACQNPLSVGCLKQINTFTSNGEEQRNIEWIPRFFSKSHFKFQGRVHEQIVSLDGKNPPLYRLPLAVLHDGYNLSDTEKEDKANRNIRLLEILLEEKLTPYKGGDLLSLDKEIQNDIAYVYFQLGKSYYFLGDYEKSADYFEEGLSFDVDENKSYVIDMVNTYGYALINSNQIDRATGLLNVYDVFSKSADFCFVIGLIKMQMCLFDEAVTEFKKATGFKEATIEGANSFLAYYNAGVIRQVQGRDAEARDFYLKCGGYYKAKERLKELS